MIPRLKFAHLPTPIEPMPRLSAELGGPRLFVKRDDQTGLATGGNKTRKLEFLLAEAQANGARTLITAGAAQSNHCRQTAAAAARYGFGCIVVLSGEPADFHTGNLLLDDLFGAEIVWSTRPERDAVLQSTFEAAWTAGRRPYKIPTGGSNATGSAGYAAAMDEFLAQNVPADWIVFPSSSGGTHAGLALGAKHASWQGHVLGISIDEEEQDLKNLVADLATACAGKLDLNLVLTPDEIEVNADYLGAGYGIMGEPEKEAIQLFARLEGLLLDPVYTGRAAAGLIGLIRRGFFKPSDTVVFWHTGGAVALFGEAYTRDLQFHA